MDLDIFETRLAGLWKCRVKAGAVQLAIGSQKPPE